VEVALPPGLHWLDIIAEVGEEGAALPLPSPSCHTFSLSVHTRGAAAGQPMLTRVVPSGGVELRPDAALLLALHFSHDFVQPAEGESFAAALAGAGSDGPLIGLRAVDGVESALLPPAVASKAAAEGGGGVEVRALWRPAQLAASTSYRLHIAAGSFRTEGGTAFLNDTEVHLYRIAPAIGPEVAYPGALDSSASPGFTAAATGPVPRAPAPLRRPAEAAGESASAAGIAVAVADEGCSCEGGGRPICDGTRYCECPRGYIGVRCERCAPGYARQGEQCQVLDVCTPAACSGRGTCYEALGELHCVCRAGFATEDPTAHCAAAARHTRTSDAGERSGDDGDEDDDDEEEPREAAGVSDGEAAEEDACDASLLPSSLDSPAYLGDSGSVRLQGPFLLDARGAHTMRFSLSASSVLRAHLTMQHVDVEMQLARVTGGGSRLKVMSTASSVLGGEALLDERLTAGAFALRLKYFFHHADAPPPIAVAAALSTRPASFASAALGAPLLGSATPPAASAAAAIVPC
jgi:hypothetical protein